MARSSTSPGYRRNSAPAWKKIAIVLAAPVAMILIIRLLNADEWPQIVFFPVLIAVGCGRRLAHGQGARREAQSRQLGRSPEGLRPRWASTSARTASAGSPATC